ncbi:permease, partial [Streptomyces sp. MCAF7]
VTSSDPNFGKITGFLLTESGRTGVFGSSGLGIVIALALGATLYAILTFGLRLDPKPDYSLVTAGDAARAKGERGVPTPDAAVRHTADRTER